MSSFDIDLGAVSSAMPEIEWRKIVASLRGAQRIDQEPVGPLSEIFAPLIAAQQRRTPLVVAQIGQSLDGRVATASGESRPLNGDQGIAHLHRLRALVDAVVIGVGTAISDDPLLTVRHCDGPSPTRVVIDPTGRMPRDARLLAKDGARRIRIGTTPFTPISDEEQISLPAAEGRIAPHAILDALFERGIERVLIEGGPRTVAAFLADGCVDRLHVVVAPILIGSGGPSLDLPPIDRLTQAVRPPTRVCQLGGGETLFDMDLSHYRRRRNGN